MLNLTPRDAEQLHPQQSAIEELQYLVYVLDGFRTLRLTFTTALRDGTLTEYDAEAARIAVDDHLAMIITRLKAMTEKLATS